MADAVHDFAHMNLLETVNEKRSVLTKLKASDHAYYYPPMAEFDSNSWNSNGREPKIEEKTSFG